MTFPHDFPTGETEPSDVDTAGPGLSARAASIYEAFLSPPPETGPLPLWFWNGRLEAPELLRQLEQFKAAGCAGAIIYPRHGLRTPYLSEEWMGLVQQAAGRGKELGLQIWLADDENWPGGVGPDAGEAWYLKVARHRAAGATIHSFHTLGQTLAACAFVTPEEGKPLDPAAVLSIPGPLRESVLEWTPPDGRAWEVLIFSAFRYPHRDFLADGAGEALLSSTHERYEAAMGDLHSAGLTGFFSDEIALLSVWSVPDEQALPWTPGLIPELTSHGVTLLDALLPLALETPDASAARQRYWQCVADRYESRFFAPVRQWITERGLQWSGHLLFEEPLIGQVMAQANLPCMARHFSIPLVDNLRLDAGNEEQNLIASIAHQGGSPAGIESFGGAGWGLDLATRRRHFDLQAARGIDRLIPHGVFYSSAGKRKLENPPSEFLREPFAGEYPIFADHVRRLGWAMNQGRPTPRVALYYPLRSAWAAIGAEDPRLMAELIEEDFRRIATLLDELHYEYELVDDPALAEAEIVSGRLRVGPVDFPILVFPSCPYLAREAWARALEFYENGGRVLCLGMLPEGFEDGPDPDLHSELMRFAAVEVETIRRSFMVRGQTLVGGQEVYAFTRKSSEGGRFWAFQVGLAADEEFARGEVRLTLNSCFPPDVECRDPRLFYRRRSLGGLDLYWIVSTADEPWDARIGLRSHGSPEIWRTDTGARIPIHQYTWVGSDQIVVTLRLRPGEGVLLAVTMDESPHVDGANFVLQSVKAATPGLMVEGYDDPEGAIKTVATLSGPPQVIWKRGRNTLRMEAPALPVLPPLRLDSGWEFQRLNSNALVLEEWRYRADERGGGRLLLWHKRLHPDWDELPPRQPLGWFPELEPLEERPPSFCWYQVPFVIQEWNPGAVLWLALEEIDASYRCWVDGEEIPPESVLRHPGAQDLIPSPALEDPMIRWIDLGAHAATGHHIITLLADYRGIAVRKPDNRQRIPLDLVPGRARLVGEFAVLTRSRGQSLTVREPRIVDPGSWTDFGYPHYSGAVRFRRAIQIPADYTDCCFFLELESAAAMVDLAIDQRPVETRVWSPFQFDVTDYLRAGETAALELTVRNTCANALLGRPDASGILGSVRLHAFRRIKLESRKP